MSASSRQPELTRQEAFWEQQLASGPAPFELPTDEPRLPAPSYFRGQAAIRLPGARWVGVSTLATNAGVDPFSVVLAAIALVAARHARRDDIWLGTIALASSIHEQRVPNPLALRVRVAGDVTVREFLGNVGAALSAAAANREVPFARVAELAGAQPLFRALIAPAGLRTAAWEETNPPDLGALGPTVADCDLIISVAASGDSAELKADYDSELFRPGTIERLLEQTDVVLGAMAAAPDAGLKAIALISQAERRRLVRDWNRTDTPYDRGACIHQLIEHQVLRAPDAVALVYAGEELTYADLNARANRLAHVLIAKGVQPDVPVGICLERSPAMVIAALAVLKAGGAYVPMDPDFPPKRLAYMIADSGTRLVLADARSAQSIGDAVEVVLVDGTPEANRPDTNPSLPVPSGALAYIIYTSGSAGDPVGVMVEHRNVANFFVGMDQRLGSQAGVWLAVTGLSHDISVLELFWTLSRGYKVVLFSTRLAAGEAPVRSRPGDAVEFGLFYFASDEGDYARYTGREKYRLLLDGAQFADDHGFCAVWTPERHFHTFGGMYPSPSVTAAALAMITKRISIRAGSVVLPLHNPVRVAEEWSLVDNLSDGRVAISFASGWQPQDFVIAPDAYADRHQRMFEGIETIRSLWRGESREAPGGDGKPVSFSTRPRPVQAELPVWVTAGGSPETFRRAGEIGANLITHLLQQSIDQLRERIAVYRKSWKEHGHPGESGKVALMLHTFVSRDQAHVRAMVHEPFKSYLKGAVGLFAAVAPKGVDLKTLSPADLDALAEHAFERYFESSGLFGTPESCVPMVNQLKQIGVTELACLMDFGIPADVVLASLPHLDELRRRCATASSGGDQSIDALIQRHKVTHLQCTPSTARMLIGDSRTASALAGLERILVGGEPLSAPLAGELRRVLPKGTCTYMYGPTETTVWSTTHDLQTEQGAVPIGKPISNTQIYLLDAALNPVPMGATGDLCIGGDGVARGYVNRPDLTRERFIGDPFRTGQRLYRTGDLARYRADGTADLLGGSDRQVTIRGYGVDRDALLAPGAPVFVPPETPTEKVLASLWEETLLADRIGANDNFFESGGHSLLAMQLARRIRERFGIELPLQDVLRRPHLRDLAAHIDQVGATTAAQAEVTSGALAEGFDYGEV